MRSLIWFITPFSVARGIFVDVDMGFVSDLPSEEEIHPGAGMYWHEGRPVELIGTDKEERNHEPYTRPLHHNN